MNEIATIVEVFNHFAVQQMEGCSSFAFPDVLQDQPFKCYIASTASGPFQTSYSSARVGGKCLVWQIPEVCDHSETLLPQPLLVVWYSSCVTPFA